MRRKILSCFDPLHPASRSSTPALECPHAARAARTPVESERVLLEIDGLALVPDLARHAKQVWVPVADVCVFVDVTRLDWVAVSKHREDLHCGRFDEREAPDAIAELWWETEEVAGRWWLRCGLGAHDGVSGWSGARFAERL